MGVACQTCAAVPPACHQRPHQKPFIDSGEHRILAIDFALIVLVPQLGPEWSIELIEGGAPCEARRPESGRHVRHRNSIEARFP